MTSTSLPDPVRSLLWLAVVAFCLGFAGFLALDRATSLTPGSHPIPSLAAAGLADDA